MKRYKQEAGETIARLEEENKAAQITATSLESAKTGLSKDLERVTEQLAATSEKLESQTSASETLQSRITVLERDLASRESAQTKLQGMFEKSDKEAKTLRAALDDAKFRLSKEDDEIDDLRAENSGHEQKEQELAQVVAESESLASRLREDLKTIERAKERLETELSQEMSTNAELRRAGEAQCEYRGGGVGAGVK